MNGMVLTKGSVRSRNPQGLSSHCAGCLWLLLTLAQWGLTCLEVWLVAEGCTRVTRPAVHQPSINAGGFRSNSTKFALFCFWLFLYHFSFFKKNLLSDLLKYFYLFVHLFIFGCAGSFCCVGYSPVVVCGLPIVVASLVAGHGLWGVQTSVVRAPRF